MAFLFKKILVVLFAAFSGYHILPTTWSDKTHFQTTPHLLHPLTLLSRLEKFQGEYDWKSRQSKTKDRISCLIHFEKELNLDHVAKYFGYQGQQQTNTSSSADSSDTTSMPLDLFYRGANNTTALTSGKIDLSAKQFCSHFLFLYAPPLEKIFDETIWGIIEASFSVQQQALFIKTNGSSSPLQDLKGAELLLKGNDPSLFQQGSSTTNLKRLKHLAFSEEESLSKSGISDFIITIGKTIPAQYKKKLLPNLYCSLLIPTGPTPDTKKIYSPTIGSRHIALTGGISATFNFFKYHEDEQLSLFSFVAYTYQYPAIETRTIPLKAPYGWGHYQLTTDNITTAPLTLFPAANILTNSVKIYPHGSLTVLTKIQAKFEQFSLASGIALKRHEKETLEQVKPIKDSKYYLAREQNTFTPLQGIDLVLEQPGYWKTTTFLGMSYKIFKYGTPLLFNVQIGIDFNWIDKKDNSSSKVFQRYTGSTGHALFSFSTEF